MGAAEARVRSFDEETEVVLDVSGQLENEGVGRCPEVPGGEPEVPGGEPETGGEQCASFEWEDARTCDGADYVNGDADHDGFLEIPSAMVEVGATGATS